MSYKVLTAGDVIDIKRMIWEGYSNKAAAEEVGVHESTISRIVTGQFYPEVEWPDSTVGAIDPVTRRKARINRKRLEEGYLTLGRAEGNPDYYPISDGTDAFTRKIQALMRGSDPDADSLHTLASEPIKEIADPDAALAARGQLDAMFDEINQQYDDELRRIASGSGEDVEDTRPKAAEITYQKWDWDQLCIAHATCKWVKAVLGEEDSPERDIVKEAVCIVLKVLPKQDWETEAASRLIFDTAERLRSDQEEENA